MVVVRVRLRMRIRSAFSLLFPYSCREHRADNTMVARIASLRHTRHSNLPCFPPAAWFCPVPTSCAGQMPPALLVDNVGCGASLGQMHSMEQRVICESAITLQRLGEPIVRVTHDRAARGRPFDAGFDYCFRRVESGAVLCAGLRVESGYQVR